MGKQISSKWKNAAVAVAFLFTLIVALCFMDWSASPADNWWQYLMMIISIIGCISTFLFDTASRSKKETASIIVWLLSLGYFIYMGIDFIFREPRWSSWSFMLLAVLLLTSTSMNLYAMKKKTTNRHDYEK